MINKWRRQGDIPEVIPEVEWVGGEPVIAREMVVRQSPVPVWLSAVLISLALFSVGYTFIEQREREQNAEIQRIDDEEDDRRVEGLVEDLQRQQIRAESERERLRLLFIGILAAQTSEERRELLREFIEQTIQDNRQNAEEDISDPPGQPSDGGGS